MPGQSERRVQRVLYESDPREADYLKMRDEVQDIRRGLSDLRHRLQTLGRSETHFWFDSIAISAAGALSVAIMALYQLEEGRRDLRLRAERSRELWADVEANPDAYAIRPGTSREANRGA